jgi:hypothetical protein
MYEPIGGPALPVRLERLLEERAAGQLVHHV